MVSLFSESFCKIYYKYINTRQNTEKKLIKQITIKNDKLEQKRDDMTKRLAKSESKKQIEEDIDQDIPDSLAQKVF